MMRTVVVAIDHRARRDKPVLEFLMHFSYERFIVKAARHAPLIRHDDHPIPAAVEQLHRVRGPWKQAQQIEPIQKTYLFDERPIAIEEDRWRHAGRHGSAPPAAGMGVPEGA